jgi:predicted transcriptional regulator
MTAPHFTTIKVSTKVRDELNQLAAAEGCTAGSMLEKLLSDYLWRLQVEAAKRAMREAPQDVWDEYMREVNAWDATLLDGIEDEKWEE